MTAHAFLYFLILFKKINFDVNIYLYYLNYIEYEKYKIFLLLSHILVFDLIIMYILFDYKFVN